MVVLPGLSVLLGLTDIILNLNLELQTLGLEFAQQVPDARIQDYPYQVSVRINDVHRCGGSIISDNRILTAAHCVKNIPANVLNVRVGSAKHFDGKSFSVRGVAIHPIYNETILDSDIAFLTLTKYLTFGPLVKPVELAEVRPLDGSLADVIGWRVGSEDSDVASDVLKVATVQLINRDSCRDLYPNNLITNRMTCSSRERFGRDPCRGDSGSPLVDKSTGKQVGVVSWGAGCTERDLPTVYASVPELIHSKEV